MTTRHHHHQRPAWLMLCLLFLFAPLPMVLALRFTPARYLYSSMSSSSSSSSQQQQQQKQQQHHRAPFLIPRGGSDAPTSKQQAIEEDDGSSDVEESESEEEISEVDEEEEEVAGEPREEFLEEGEDTEVVDEEEEEEVDLVEEVVEEIEEEEEELVEEEELQEIEEEEEEVAVVYPTEEILPSGDETDNRSFHTTDGELADDEGMYTDGGTGGHESPIADEDEEEIVATSSSVPAAAPTSDDNDDDTTDVATAVSVNTIDDATKQVLTNELRYTRTDVSNMRPEIAPDVVRNRLMKPEEGMPVNWYIDPANAVAAANRKKKTIVLSAVVGALALAAGVLRNQDELEDLVDALKGLPETIAALFATAAATKTKIDTAKATVADAKDQIESLKEKAAAALDDEQEEEEKEKDTNAKNAVVAEQPDQRAHSIKPGTSPEDIPDPHADKTALDKILTKIEASIKSFWNKEI